MTRTSLVFATSSRQRCLRPTLAQWVYPVTDFLMKIYYETPNSSLPCHSFRLYSKLNGWQAHKVATNLQYFCHFILDCRLLRSRKTRIIPISMFKMHKCLSWVAAYYCNGNGLAHAIAIDNGTWKNNGNSEKRIGIVVRKKNHWNTKTSSLCPPNVSK